MLRDASFSRYVESLARFRRLDAETERRLAERWRATREAGARRSIVEAHLLFVVKIAGELGGYGVPVAELVGEGNVGLLEALDRFDPSHDTRFITYAGWWIRARMFDHIRRHWSIVRFPTSAQRSRVFFRLARERARVLNALGHDAPTDEVDRRLAERLGVSSQRIREVTTLLEARDVSLDAPVGPDGSFTLLHSIADGRDPPDNDASHRERARIVRGKLGAIERGLSRRERFILRHRMLADEPETLGTIGRRFGISRERARQLEVQVKRKLRRALAELAPDRRPA